LLLLSAAAAVLSDPAVPPVRQATATPEKKICKTFAVTGSRLAKERVCMTADEWRMEEALRNRDFEEAQRRSASQR